MQRHRTIDPTILYFGTPAARISTPNPDGTLNLAPMSSAGWFGWSCMLGLGLIDPARWQPLTMSFCRFFARGAEIHPSRLAESEFMKQIARAS